MELPSPEPVTRASVEVRQRPAPGLERPVRAVGRRAGSDLEGKLWPVVSAALVSEGGPVPARVILPEPDLRPAGRRLPRVDCSPGANVHRATAYLVAHQRLTVRIDAKPDGMRVPVDDLRSGRGRCGQQQASGRQQQQEVASHILEIDVENHRPVTRSRDLRYPRAPRGAWAAV